ncbi:ribosome-associated GTPase EngA [Spongiibacter sp. IMCC21906]|jgi:GTP-binding protein|uniref:ribosome biogenesis GTPase Der n=1 Tax=Spongiibacter sp. IMCC21906 TaxID=1620392 RepID=UPI00062DF897|nr:ribosome biogenesis GTPase Der [Spongiibacter sp. IMCC21906]AKH70252.1 ribosome-associated GTPase EngA [Spongiibacter sp. IMCC21906]
MIPVIALVGRPNVGKSTLFNRLTKSRDALVANFPGLTRDRKYGEALFGDRRFMVIDTGGITGDEEGIDSAMAQQSLQAIDEADAVLLMLDSRAGLMPADQGLIQHLRSCSKPVFFVANKVDGTDPDVAMAEFYQTGAAQIYPLTATHGKGVRKLLQDVLEQFPESDEADAAALASGKKIAVVGRPNVGKSTLVNRMLGEDRVVVFDQPGTTRDSIYINYERDGEDYTLIDTAGVRKRRHIHETVEKFSIVKTLKAIDDANVVILVMDGQESIVDQDLHLLGQVIDAGRAVVVAINKWDGLDSDKKAHIKTTLDRRLQFIDFAEIHFISALHGTGVGHLYESIEKAYESATRQLATRNLTMILEGAVYDHAPPMINGRRIKLRLAHPGGNNPPIVVIHGNQTDKVPASYTRYLEKVFRRELKMVGTPIRIQYKTSDNPYEGKKNTLTKRQIDRKRRLVSFVKKKDSKKKRGR